MSFPRRIGAALVFLELTLAESCRLSRLAILRQKVSADAIDQHPERRLLLACVERRVVRFAEPRQIDRQHREMRMAEGTVVEERPDAARDSEEQIT